MKVREMSGLVTLDRAAAKSQGSRWKRAVGTRAKRAKERAADRADERAVDRANSPNIAYTLDT